MNVLYLVKHFPCRSQTFVMNEVAALRAWGCGVHVVSAIDLHELIDVDAADVSYLRHGYLYRYGNPPTDPASADRHVREARAALTSTGGPVPSGLRQSLWDLLGAAEPDERLRARGFLDALAVVSLIKDRGVTHLHGDFAEDNVKLAHLVSRAVGVPFSFKMRAYDIFAEPHPDLPEWAAAARCIFTISRYNRDYICRTWGIDPGRVVVVYDGVNLTQATPIKWYSHRPFRILSVSRLVEKKGFGVLLDACRMLRRRIEFRCDVYGDGPMKPELEKQVEALELGDCVKLHGSRPHEQVLAAMESASVFALACVQATNGDRDGTPNALLEAMARGIPVVSTTLSGIPEIVETDVEGLLVAPGNAAALADAIARIHADRRLAETLREAAQHSVRQRFTIDRTVQGFLDAVRSRTDGTPREERQRPGRRM